MLLAAGHPECWLLQAWYREGSAAAQLQQWEEAANAFFAGYQAEPTNNLLAAAFKDAIKQGQAQHRQTNPLL